MSTTKKATITTTTTTELFQCGAAKKNGEQCSAKCTTGSQVCAFHKGTEPTFSSKALEHCSATTQKGAPCKNAVVRNGLCGTHSRDTSKPRKPSSRIGKVTANNVFTKGYWAGKPKGTGTAQECARLWKQAKESESELYKKCVEIADTHNTGAPSTA